MARLREHLADQALGGAHAEIFFNDTTKEAVLEQWIDLKNEINESPGLRKREFKSLWPAMLSQFTCEYK